MMEYYTTKRVDMCNPMCYIAVRVTYVDLNFLFVWKMLLHRMFIYPKTIYRNGEKYGK